MSEKSQAAQIEDLMRLRDQGALTEDEFTAAKARILNTVGREVDLSLSENISRGASSLAGSFAGSLNESEASFRKLAWILYWVTAVANLISFFPIFAWVSFVMWIVVTIIATLKLGASVDTIYNSHFRNLVTTAIVSTVGYVILFLVTVGTLGFGLIITIPLGVVLIIWYVYRLVKGMLRLNESKAM